MASKAVIQRQKTAEDLKAALERQGPEAAAELSRALAPVATEVRPVPDLEDFQELLRLRLEQCRLRLLAADEAHRKDLSRLRVRRWERDEAVAELRRLLARMRSWVDGAYGTGSSADVLALEGPTPRDPVVLSRRAAQVIAQLREAPHLPAEPSLLGPAPDAGRWIALLEEPLTRLDQALFGLAHEKQDAVSSLIAKNEAQTEYDRLYRSTTRMLQEFFRYVGMDEMAATVRPRRRRAAAPREEAPAAEAEELPAAEETEASAVAGEGGTAWPVDIPHLALLPAPRPPEPADRSSPSG